jgi:peptidoglycan/xylan/chitin deacetylase (PgdA/CDA1 family)
MDDGIGAVGGKAHPPARAVRPADARHPDLILHRRRRAVALIVIGALALAAGIWVGAGSEGGSATHRAPAIVGPGYFARIQKLAGKGRGSFAGIEQAAENTAINHTLTYTPYVRIAGSQHREMALTFDDGPGPYTPQILSTLERTGAPGTFFEVGVLEQYFHASTAAIVARGYPIGDHTFTHAPMGELAARDQRPQLLEQVRAIAKYGAPFPRLFRPPYGSWDDATLKLLHKYRMLMILWTVDTGDYRKPGVGAIVHAAVTGARPGAIILMHDAGGDRSQTVKALPKIIRQLRARGYKLVTVPRLLLDNPPPHNQQISAVIGTGG